MAVAGGALVVVAALIVALVVVPQSGPSVATASPGPTASGSTESRSPGPVASGSAASPSPGATGSPASSPATASWGRLELPPVLEVAELTADAADAAGPDPGTTFTLRSLADTPAATLAAGLTAEPAIAWTVEPGPDPSRAVIRPAAALDRGATYRFALAAPDGATAGGWAFRVAGPPRVVGTIPTDETTDVPIDTGIEIAFDRDDVADPAAWLSIDPAVDGRLQRHGRTWVFVPTALQPSTVYTVTLRPGVPVEGSREALETGTRTRFETAGPRAERPVSIGVGRSVLEVAPGTPPIIGIYADTSGDRRPPASVDVAIHRIAGVEAAAAAAAALLDRPTWASHPSDAVDVAVLPIVARERVPLVFDQGAGYAGSMRFPAALDAGWYLVDLPDDVAAGQQVLLQVTPVAAFAASARDRTVTWVNRTGDGPIEGAVVRLAEGPVLGRTGADGLLVAATPARAYTATRWDQVAAQLHPVLIVEVPGTGSVVVPLGLDSGSGYRWERWDPMAGADTSPWMSSLSTDRSTFRRTDSVAAWGIVRDMASGAVPASVRLALSPMGPDDGWWNGGGDAIPVLTVDATPSAEGVFDVSLAFADLPLGPYALSLSAGGTTLESQWIEVGVIRKPAYRVTVTTDRRAVMEGDRVPAIVTASFYDGTPVPGLPVDVSFTDENGDATDVGGHDPTAATTGPDGRVILGLVATTSGTLSAASASPELGEIVSPDAALVVFPAAVFVTVGSAEIVGGAVRASGLVRSVDLAAVESRIAAGEAWGDDVGPPAPGARVQVTVASTVWVPVRSGTAYDFILKRTVPTYRSEERHLPTVRGTATTGPDGRFLIALTLPAAARTSEANVRVTTVARDAGDREASAETYAYRPAATPGETQVWLDPGTADAPESGLSVCGGSAHPYAVGDPVRLTLRDGSGPLATDGSPRFLFVEARDGIRGASVADVPVFGRTFDRGALPDLDITGVAWDGSTFRATTFGLRATVDLPSRRLGLTVTSDLSAGSTYEPRGTAHVTVATVDAAGKPVAADVVIRAIDQKLYDAGVAWDDDPIASVYAGRDAAIAATYASHQVPADFESPGCGNTTGGGAGGGALRADFRDRILFLHARTDPDGRLTVPVPLPDDLTAWHVAAMAVSDDLRIGTAMTTLPVGLPFFVEPVAPDTVLATDRPSILLRAFGSGLRAGDRVTYVVRAPTLRPDAVTVEVAAFASAAVPLAAPGVLGPLPVGTHAIVVEGTAQTAAGAVHDAKEVRLEVVATRAGTRRTEVIAIASGIRLPGAPDAVTTCTFTDAGRASLVPVLESVVAGDGPRADQRAAASAAAGMLVSEFGRDAASLPAGTLDPTPFLAYTDAGTAVALVPYGSAELELTALAALGAPDVFPASTLTEYLRTIAASASETRERRIVALAGLAALGEPVADDLRSAVEAPGLTPTERAWLAVGLGESGALTDALRVERALLAESGERSGGWARVRTGTTAHDAIAATALVAIAAARVGDPLAADLAAYVRDERDPEAVHVLEQVAYAERAITRLPRTSARLAWTIDGTSRTAELGADGPVSLTLTPTQRAGIVLEPLAGSVSAACAWETAAAPGALPDDASVSVVRTVSPSGAIPAGSLVTIELRVSLGPLAPSGLYRAVEVLPAGLAPTGSLVGPHVGDGDAARDRALPPWEIDGNRAEWGFWRDATDPSSRTFRLRTAARVVAPGTYAWEPAVVQSVTAPAIGASVPATTVTVLAP